METSTCRNISLLLIGTSLSILGSVFVFSGSLSWLGWSIFFPLMAGGLGLVATSANELVSVIHPQNKWRSACLLIQKILPRKMTF